MRIFDSHSHYYGEKFEDTIENYLSKYPDLTICQIGYDKKTNDLVMSQRKQFKNVYCAIGVHPNDVTSIDKEYAKELEENIKNCDALKTGLDYYYTKENMQLQKEWFKIIIELANKYNKPVVIHSRDAQEDTLEFLKLIKSTFVLHCFAYDLNAAKFAIKEGGYVSFSGVVTYKNAAKVKEVASVIDFEKVLVETDCPYLAPVPYRGKTNFPHYTEQMVRKVAELRNISIEEVAEQTYKNAVTFYGGKYEKLSK